MTDFSFIRLFKNDFASAKKADDTPVMKLPHKGFIVQKPNEYFLQTTASDTDISFIGAIQVDLVNCSGLVKRNIDSNFYYIGFVDSNGINQISFAFGYIGVDFWTEPLYLKITDLINGNIWYSNSFLVTNYRTELSARFDYFNKTKLYNISYDLAPYKQSIRFAECYDQTPANKKELKQYTTSQGKQVNYRPITTFLRKYMIEGVDYQMNDALEVLFSHSEVYLDGERVVVSDYKIEDRKGDVNFMTGEFVINKQGQKLEFSNQIYHFLNVVSKIPNSVWTLDTLPNIQIVFNKNISLTNDFEIKLYKDGVLQTIAPTTYTVTGNVLDITPSFAWTNGSYQIIIEANKIYANGEYFKGFGVNEWTFEITDGEFDNTEFDNTEFLTN